MEGTSSPRVPKDLVAGLLFLIIGIAALAAIPANVVAARDEFGVGPRFVPRWTAIIMVGLSALLIVKSLVSVARGTHEPIPLLTAVPTLEGFGVIGLVAVWLLGLQFASYLPVTSVVVVLGLALFRVRDWRSYVVGLLFVVATWAAFSFILNVRLP